MVGKLSTGDGLAQPTLVEQLVFDPNRPEDATWDADGDGLQNL